MIEITAESLRGLKEEAKHCRRKRKNLNYHPKMDDPINRMVHAMNPGTYIQPHKHEDPDKREIFIILEGRVAVIEFDDHGNVIQNIILDRTEGKYGVEIPACTWHSIIALEEDSMVYEVKDGPYSSINDKHFASWAPAENSDGGRPECQHFLEDLKRKLAIR